MQIVQFKCIGHRDAGRAVSKPSLPMCQLCVRLGSRRTITCVCHGLTAVVKWAGGCRYPLRTGLCIKFGLRCGNLVPTSLDATCTPDRLLLLLFQR